MRHWLGLALISLTLDAFAQAATDPVQQALAQAAARRVPVLVDFQAPWCYSCYYMASHVMNGPEWERAERETLVVELDADSPDGARWMQEWNVKVLPTYVLLDSQGNEFGRILGEQTRGDFYNWLFELAARGSTLEGLRARVTDASAESVNAARDVLATHHARLDPDGGLTWVTSLPSATRIAVMRDAGAAAWIARLELQRAAKENEASACLKAGRLVLDENLGCERPYELNRAMECAAGTPGPERQNLLRSQLELMQLLFEKRVLADAYRCADERSVVLVTAELMKELGDEPGEMLVLQRAISGVRARLGENIGSDRNLADNLRVYLDRAGMDRELEDLLYRLITAYPEDYVYAHRMGRQLASRGEHATAVQYFEHAAQRAYGVNRLRNAEHHAQSLNSLGRLEEARVVASEALRLNGPWFPEDAARLKALVEQPEPTPIPEIPPAQEPAGT